MSNFSSLNWVTPESRRVIMSKLCCKVLEICWLQWNYVNLNPARLWFSTFRIHTAMFQPYKYTGLKYKWLVQANSLLIAAMAQEGSIWKLHRFTYLIFFFFFFNMRVMKQDKKTFQWQIQAKRKKTNNKPQTFHRKHFKNFSTSIDILFPGIS